MNRANLILRLLLVFILLLLTAYVLLNYNALLNADSYTYLIYARTLAQGSLFGDAGFFEIFKDHWPEGRSIDLHSGLRHMIDGRIYHSIEMGYPLFLAGAMVVAGPGAAYFVNPILFLWLIIVFFLTVRLVFFKSSQRELVALLSLLILLLIPPDRLLSSATKIMRDIPPLTFTVTGFYCLLRALRPNRRPGRWLFIGAFFLGLASLIRFHYLIMALPYFLYLIASLRAGVNKGLKMRAVNIVFALMGLAVFALPVLIRDIMVNGDIFSTARTLLNHLLVGSDPLKLFSPDHFSSSGLGYLDYLLRNYTPVLLFLGAVGLASGLKIRGLRLLLLPAALLHFLLFAFFRYHHSRYLLPIYPVISVLIGYGIIVALNWILSITSRSSSGNLNGRLCRAAGGLLLLYLVFFGVFGPAPVLSTRYAVLLLFSVILMVGPGSPRRWLDLRRLVIGLLICLTFLLAVRVVPSIIHPHSFNLSDARRLEYEIEKYVPAGSLILSSRYLKQNIDYYTDCYSLNIHQPGLPWGLSTEEALREVMDSGVEVFVLDNKGKRKAKKFLPVLREHFDLDPVARWRSDDLKINARYVSEREYLNLYRVLKWKKKEVLFTVSPTATGDHLLIIDTGKAAEIPEQRWLRLSAGGRLLDGEIVDGVNYIYLDQDDTEFLSVVMKLESDLPLPANIPIRYLGELKDGFYIDIGEDATPEDWRFLGEGFFNDLSRGGDRTIFDKGSVRIPSFSVPGKTMVVRFRIRNILGKLSPLHLTISLDGVIIREMGFPASDQWKEFELPIPVSHSQVSTSFLELSARPERPSSLTEEIVREKGLLSLDWVEIEW